MLAFPKLGRLVAKFQKIYLLEKDCFIFETYRISLKCLHSAAKQKKHGFPLAVTTHFFFDQGFPNKVWIKRHLANRNAIWWYFVSMRLYLAMLFFLSIEKWKIFRSHFLEWFSSQLQNEGWEREWRKSPPESFNGFLLFLYYILVVAYSLLLGIKYSPFLFENWIAYSEKEC